MGKTLLVAEKPSVARDIARVMGVRGKGEGYLSSDELLVTWAIGHLVRLSEPDELDPAYKRWSLEQLPILPESWTLEPIAKTRSQFAVVKRLMKSKEVDALICATDAGREGELIFRWIYELAGCRKPVKRLWVNSMTDEAIREGMAALKPDERYDALYQSALCRARADWLVGMNLSRAFTVKHNALLTIGRVQTPTLALLVERKKQIDDFKPQTTYTAEANFGAYRGTYFDPKRGKADDEGKTLQTREAAQRIVEAVKGRAGVVKSCERSIAKEAPPLLFDLTALQREANKRFGFTAKKTLGLAQALYEKHKLITYPRTDCRLLPLDVKPKADKALRALPEPYASLAPTALGGLAADKSGRVFRKEINSDHHAIIPTGKPIAMDKLAPDERKLMDMLVRRLLSAFYPPYEARKQEIVTEVDGLPFYTSDREHMSLGWKAVEGKPESLPKLPEVKAGERYPVKSTEVAEHVSKPPSPYTDASILYAMEHAGKLVEDDGLKEIMKKHGLGTPATRAAILERLIEVGYAERRGKSLLPTDKGCKLIACVPPTLASAELTGKWEYGLNLIAEQANVDKAFTERFMSGVARMTVDMVEAVKSAQSAVAFDAEARGGKKGPRRAAPKAQQLDAACPVCGKGKVTENERAFGCSRWKQGCAMTIWKDCLARHGGPTLTKVIVERLLRDGYVKGSTGVVSLSGGQLRFTFADSAQATPPVAIVYQKPDAGNAPSGARTAKAPARRAGGARKRKS